MNPEQVVNAFIAAIEAKDVPAAVALCAADVSYENMPIQPIQGRDAMAVTLERFLAPATDVQWPCINQWVVGNLVINERLDRFKIGDGWLELPIAGFFEVNADGLITLWRDYFDMASYARQLETLTKGE